MAKERYPCRRRNTNEPCRIVRVKTSLTEAEEREYTGYAKQEEMTLAAWLSACLAQGIEVRIMGLLHDEEIEEGLQEAQRRMADG